MLEEILRQGAAAMGLDAAHPGLSKMCLYLERMLERNQALNLTAVKDPEEAVRLHLLDSLGIFGVLDLAGKTVLDVGTGGGMPGVAIALYAPTAAVHLMDATAKKLDFIREAAASVGIHPQLIGVRAEDYARGDMREGYDVVTARAVAGLPILAELCLPLVKPGGYFVAYKGAAAAEELQAARKAIEILGGGAAAVHSYRIPGIVAQRCLIIIKKEGKTPNAYPRSYGQIKKKPL